MNKLEIKNLLIQALVKDLEALQETALEAKKAATHEEAKAENKYDTRGLEASYLAGAQAKRAEELRVIIDKLNKLDFILQKSERVEITSLVQVQDQEGKDKYFFLLPYAGGTKIVYNKQDVFVVTLQSPMGKNLLGLMEGDEVKVSNNTKATFYEIVKIY